MASFSTSYAKLLGTVGIGLPFCLGLAGGSLVIAVDAVITDFPIIHSMTAWLALAAFGLGGFAASFVAYRAATRTIDERIEEQGESTVTTVVWYLVHLVFLAALAGGGLLGWMMVSDLREDDLREDRMACQSATTYVEFTDSEMQRCLDAMPACGEELREGPCMVPRESRQQVQNCVKRQRQRVENIQAAGFDIPDVADGSISKAEWLCGLEAVATGESP